MASPFLNSRGQQGTVSAHQPATQEQQRQPQPGAQPDKAENREGFDCEFVERPPEVLQSECPVCLQIIRDPYQISCCGYSFCRSCIERIKADNKPCPTCNTKGFSDFSDKRLKRSLYSFKVRCSHQKDGCEWTGELGQFDVHLNKDPPPEKRLTGCQLVKIDCLYCEEKQQRQYIQGHQNENCMKRPFSCEYCHDYESNFDDVIHNHWPECGFHPVRCPNECGSFPQRQKLDSHVADECPLTTISCDFVHVGCGVKLPRKDMPEHVRENLLTHTSLLAVSHAKQQAQIVELVAENDTLRSKNVNLEQNHRSLENNSDSLGRELTSLQEDHTTLSTSHAELQAQISDLNAEVNSLKESHETLKASNQQLKQEATANSLKVVVPRTIIPVVTSDVLAMNNFKQHKKDGDDWYSPPVYTHHQGYKLCLRVDANGCGSGAGTHVSVYVLFMRGEFDDSLKWPFSGVISFRLLDQVKGEDHKTHSLTYDDTVEDQYCGRAIYRERPKRGWGQSQFISHSQLNPKYLRKDTLQFQICDGGVHV